MYSFFLKIVKVVPVYKEESKLDYHDYCSISLSSNIEKIIERLMCKHLYKFLSYNNILSELQFGFRQKIFTTHALITLTENLRQTLDERKSGCRIFVDLQKVFDTVNMRFFYQN